MQLTEKMYCYIQAVPPKGKRYQEWIRNGLSFGRIVFNPLYIEFNQQILPFSVKTQDKLIDAAMLGDNFILRIHDQWSETVIQRHNEVLFERHYFTKEQFEQNRPMIFDYVKLRMEKATFAYIRSYDEFLYHNIEQPNYRKIIESEEEMAHYPKKKNTQGEVIIDGNYFAGFDIFHVGFCLTSCWQMYFSPSYSEILPLNLIREVQQVDRVEELATGTILVELYKDPYRWNTPANLHFQRMFRNQLGIDQLSWLNGVGVLREPFVEYRTSFNLLQIIQYQNDFLQPVPKSQSTHFVTRMYNPLTKEEQVSRIKGTLNTQAYFPLINERQRKMKTVITLFVDQTIDEGLEAYEFYLRQYLAINLDDKKYKSYTPIITFFLPDEYVTKIPLAKLKERMSDVLFSKEKMGRKKSVFSVKKGEVQLQVELLPLSTIYPIEKASST